MEYIFEIQFIINIKIILMYFSILNIFQKYIYLLSFHDS